MMETVLLFRTRMIPFTRNAEKDRRDGKKEKTIFDLFKNIIGLLY